MFSMSRTRTLICRAYLESGITQKFGNAVDMYDKVLKIMRWGRNEWPTALKDDRGAVLEDTYVLGVRRLRLVAYMQVRCSQGPIATPLFLT